MTVALGSAYGEIQIGTGEAEKSVASLASTLRSVGTTMSLAISAPLMAVAGAGLAAAGSFEQSMNQIQVVSGATGEQMNAMREKALQLGRDTAFSAGEAADGLLELSKAGMSADEAMASISGVLDLAAAGNLSVAQAAEIAANALNAFNLPADEAGRVADLLAAAANASSVEVTDMATAFQMSAAVFSSNKQSIDDLSTAIAILGNNGLKGSDAGTSLKTMLMRLTAPTDQAAAALQDLGVQVYNADGSMRSFQDIVGQLETATTGLSDAQRNQALTTIFGADAIRAVNILVREGSGEFDRMKAAVNQAGAAQAVADARMKGLSGAIAYLKGTIESTLIAAFLPMTEALGNLIRQSADLIAQFANVPEPVRNAALAFLAVLAAAGPVMLAISGIGAVLGALLSPVGLIVLAVGGLAAAWASDFMGIRAATTAAVSVIAPTLQALGQYLIAVAEDGDYLNDWLTHLPEAMQAPVAAIGQFMAETGTAFQQFVTTAQTVWQQFMAFMAPAFGRLQEAFSGLGAQFGELAPKFGDLGAAAQELFSALQPLIAAVGVALAIAVNFGVNALAAAFANASGLIGPMVDQITATVRMIATVVREVTAIVVAVINGDWAGAWAAAQRLVAGFGTFVQTSFRNYQAFIQTTIAVIKTAVVNTLTDMGVDVESVLSNLESGWQSTWNSISSITSNIVATITGTLNSIVTFVSVTIPNAFNAFKTFLSGFSLPNPFEALSSAINAIRGGIDALKNKLNEFAEWLSSFSLPSINLPSVPGFATGTAFAPGGLALVGERGPELIDLPRGSRVYDNRETQRMLGSAGATNITIENHFHVSSEMDIESAARRIVEMVRMRGR